MKLVIAPRIRSGVSLLEVLVSVFVLSVGLLGVAALLPIGRYKVAEATKADRAGACGRSAMQEVKVRDWLNPENWVAMNVYGRYSGLPQISWPPLMPPDDSLTPEVDESRCIPWKDSFAIDPLFIATANNATFPRTAWFPLYPVVDPVNQPGQATALRRVTIRRPDATFNTASPFYSQFFGISWPAADQILTWHDDQIFPRPEDPEERPRQMALWDDGSVDMVPKNVSTTAAVLSRLAEDNYSWMATVTPLLSEVNAAVNSLAYSDIAGIAGYEVSIVVFYKRNFQFPVTPPPDPEDLPQERSAYAVLVGGGSDGGDVFLAPESGVAARYAWLDIKRGDWLMLRGLDGGPPTTISPPPPTTNPIPNLLDRGRVVAKWYRVVAVDDEMVIAPTNAPAPVAGLTGRYVTLEGPDWSADNDGNGLFDPTLDWAEATLVDNVEGVYTTTINLDQQ